jgi:hypothetical protein
MIAGGVGNKASAPNAMVAGGDKNTASGWDSMVVGGTGNVRESIGRVPSVD